MTKDEALKLALEALEGADMIDCDMREAITAIKEALAQPDEDYKRGYADAMNWKVQNHLEHLPPKEQAPMNYYRADAEGNLERTDIHFAQPEPVACDCDSPAWCKQYKRCNRTMLGLMPYVAQRTWVGLTDDEIDQGLVRTKYAMQTAGAWRDGVEWAVKQLQERNT